MFITRLVGVMGGGSLVSTKDALLQLKTECPYDLIDKARKLQISLSTTKFDIAFGPLAPRYAMLAAIMFSPTFELLKEPEFLYNFYFDPETPAGRDLGLLRERLGNAPLRDYLKRPHKQLVLAHACDAWNELKEENALHETEHTVLVLGPSTLIAAIGLLALGENWHRDRNLRRFVKQLLSCDPESFSYFDISFEYKGHPEPSSITDAKIVPFPAESVAA